MVEIVKELGKPRNYLPVVVGVTAGIVGGQFVIEQVKGYVASQFPGNDTIDMVARLGVTVAAVAVYLATSKGKADFTSVTINTAAIGAIGVGAYSFIAKLLQWQPIAIGRVRAGRTAVRPVTVVRKEQTPIYRAAPAAVAVY